MANRKSAELRARNRARNAEGSSSAAHESLRDATHETATAPAPTASAPEEVHAGKQATGGTGPQFPMVPAKTAHESLHAPSKPNGMKRGRGRPRTVDRAGITRAVFRKLSIGHSLRASCKQLGVKPATLLDWVREDSVLAERYARAREAQAHHLAERAIAVSRKAFGRDTAGVQAARLEVDTIKWYVGRMHKSLFGDSVTVDGTQDTTIRVVFEDAQPPAVANAEIADAEFAIEGD